MTSAELERIIAMERWMQEATATRVEPWRFGSAIFTDDFPGRYDSNFLRVERPVGAATPAALAAEADRLQASLGHRGVTVESEDEGAGLAGGFRELGYVVERLVYMVLRTEPMGPPALAVREVSPEELRPTLVSSYCELYLHEGAAQVEDVNTLEAFRNRGAARAVVVGAIAAARTAGADLVWIAADADDWARHLYAKLGFEQVGGAWQFTKMAPQHLEMQGAAVLAP